MKNVVQHDPKSTEYMSAGMQAKFRDILIRQQTETRAAIDQGDNFGEAEHIADENDLATAREAAALQIRQHDRASHHLRKISKSLKKIEDDEYGYCEACGEEIGEARLEARPTADLCISCKELSESKENLFAKKRAA